MSGVSGTDALEALFAGSGGGRPTRRRGRGAIIAAWIVGGLIVLLGIAAVVADGLLRGAAESVAAQALEQKLPEGSSGHVTVSIGGFSFLTQYLAGSFDDVQIDSSSLTLDGVPASLHLHARGVPTTLTEAVGSISGTVAFTPVAVATLLPVPGATGVPTLGNGTIASTVNQQLAGGAVAYSVTAKPTFGNGSVTLTPTAVTVTSAPPGTNSDEIVNDVLAHPPTTICVASRLPSALSPTGFSVDPNAARIAVAGKNVRLTSSLFGTKGSCS